jgi:hypothetical protein
MNDQELQALLDDHYLGEAQTLTTGAEANLLKLKEMRGTQSAAEAERWAEIKRGFARHQLNTGDEDDPVTRVTNQLSALGENIHGVRESILAATTRAAVSAAPASPSAPGPDLGPYVLELNQVLKALAAHTATPVSPAATPPAVGAELVPYVERLDQVLAALARRPEQQEAPAPAAPVAPDFTPYLEQLNQVLRHLAKAQAAGAKAGPAAPAPGISEGQFKQLAVVRNTLRAVLEDAQGRLKGEGELSAAKVWKQLTQAMELLESIQ